MLELDSSALIGKGLHRECFIHPQDPTRCIKIIVAGHSNENRREARYYSLLARRGISWDMLTRFHGLLQTNLGEGAVFDLVRDFDGAISRPLTHYLDSEEFTATHGDMLATAFGKLRDYLLQNRVITMTLKTKNILLQLTGENSGKLVIVDNVGNSDFIPITNYSAGLARLKIRRKWRRFEQSVRDQHAANRALARVLS